MERGGGGMRRDKILVRTSDHCSGEVGSLEVGGNRKTSRDVSAVPMSTPDRSPSVGIADDDDGSDSRRKWQRTRANGRPFAADRRGEREREREERARHDLVAKKFSGGNAREHVETQTRVPARLVTLPNPIHTEAHTGARNVIRERQRQAVAFFLVSSSRGTVF